MLENADYFVRLIAFPKGSNCNGMVMANDDGTYSVYLNASAGQNAQKKAMRHELSHMEHGDLDGEKRIEAIEEAL